MEIEEQRKEQHRGGGGGGGGEGREQQRKRWSKFKSSSSFGAEQKAFNIHMNRATSYSYDEANISTTIA